MIPLLNMGKQGLKDRGDELEKFGGISPQMPRALRKCQ